MLSNAPLTFFSFEIVPFNLSVRVFSNPIGGRPVAREKAALPAVFTTENQFIFFHSFCNISFASSYIVIFEDNSETMALIKAIFASSKP